MGQLTWEEAVRWYRAQPGNETEIRKHYFDLPVRQAVERYANSEEFAEVLLLLGSGNGRPILDLGAGNGIASFALARNGWSVTALEPDPSDEVGAGAIRELASETMLPITVVQEFGETLPLADNTFDAIHAREVLHHAANLELMLHEVARVLRSGGMFLATREHVVNNEQELTIFRNTHPLHHLYGGENAYSLDRYLGCLTFAGLEVVEIWGAFESILNFAPGTEKERQRALRHLANRSYFQLGRLFGWSPGIREKLVRRHTRRDRTPGRIYSFLVKKP